MKRVGRLPSLIAAGVVVAVVSCTDINDSADHVAALEFSTLPYPAVVAGDTLRDTLGVATPLHAIAYNGGGGEVAAAELQYIALDTGLTITPAGLVISTRRSGVVPIIASSAALQSRPLALLVTRSPDTVVFSGNTRDTITYDLLSPATAISKDLALKVITKDTVGGVTGTQGWLVAYQVTFRNGVIAEQDTSVVYVSDGTRRSTVDTTALGGAASRKLRLRLVGLTPPAVDSVFVTATVRHKGAKVRGSPLRFVILLRPK